jgi:RHS repeat-associated protein
MGTATTSYSADVTTVKDETGVMRKSQIDGLGRLHQVTENPSGLTPYVTTYTYDVLDNVTSVQQSGQPRSFVYDSLGRLVQATNPESGVICYGLIVSGACSAKYDKNGNLLNKTDPRGVVTAFSYDSRNRLTGKSYTLPSGVAATPSVAYCYGQPSPPSGCPSGISNAMGRLTQVSSTASTTAINGYTVHGQVMSSTQTTGGASYSFGYTYDLAGALSSITYPSGRTVSYTFDGAGRPSSVTGELSGTTTNYTSSSTPVSYAPHGAVQTMQLKNGLTESWTYNAKLQPTQMTVGSLLTLNYGYSAPNRGNNGNVYSQTMQRGSNTWSQTYAYDLINRLETAQETGAGSWTESYEYDAFGNRWLCTANSCANSVGSSATDPGRAGLPGATLEMPVASSWYNGNNQIIGWQYDPSGNITQVGGMTRSFTYDGENRQATGSVAGATVTYAYDGDGRRLGKTVMWPAGMQSADNLPSQQTTVYVYDASGQLAAEYGPTTEIGTTYLTVDSLGSTRLETNGSGQVIGNYDYLPFGQDIAAGTAGRDSTFAAAVYPGPPSGPGMFFTSKERDAETGLDYFGARYFSSSQGRFTSPDWSATPQPVPYADLTDPQTLNLYSYVRNNPLRRADPDGHCPECVEFLESPAVQQAAERALSVTTGIVVGAYVGTRESVQRVAADFLTYAVSHGGKSAAQQDLDDVSGRTVAEQTGQLPGRSKALNDAKRDAGVSTSQQPETQQNVPLTDQSGKQVVVNGKPQTSREYTHTTGSGDKVVIQDHSQGHSFPDGGTVGPHINVRPQGDTRNGTVPGTDPHYPYNKPGEN